MLLLIEKGPRQALDLEGILGSHIDRCNEIFYSKDDIQDLFYKWQWRDYFWGKDQP